MRGVQPTSASAPAVDHAAAAVRLAACRLFTDCATASLAKSSDKTLQTLGGAGPWKRENLAVRRKPTGVVNRREKLGARIRQGAGTRAHLHALTLVCCAQRFGATVALGTIAFAVEFGAIQSGVKAVDTRVSELSTRVGEGNTNLSKRISEGITSLNGHLSSLDARVTDTNNRLTKLEDNVTHIGRTLEGMSKMLAKLANTSAPPRTPKDDA